jgi:hypothetical protein
MARKDLAGLAALGALGYMLKDDKPTKVEDRFGSGAGTPYDMRDMRGGAEDERPAPTGMGEATRLLAPDRNENFSNEGRTGITRTPVGAVPRRRPVTSQSASSQAAPSQSAPAPAPARAMSREEAMAELDRATGTKAMDPNAARGPNAVTGTDFSRNVSNTLNALTPIGGGVGKVGVDMAYRGRNAATAAEKFREAATARKAAEGYSPAEALSVLQKGAGKNVPSVGREEVTNPMMWAAGPKNAKNFKEPAKDLNKRASKEERLAEEGFSPTEALAEIEKRGPKKWQAEGVSEWKRGGKIKKMASGKMTRSSASKRGDGIASKGKTKGRIY